MQVPEVKSDVKPVQKSGTEETDSLTPSTKKRKRVTMAEPDKEPKEEAGSLVIEILGRPGHGWEETHPDGQDKGPGDHYLRTVSLQ